MATTPDLPADFFDDGDEVLTYPAGGQSPDNSYDEQLSGLDDPEFSDETPKPDNAPAANNTPPADAPPASSEQVPAATDSWEPAPQAIPDWQTLASQQNIQVGSEAEFREQLTLRQYAQSQFERDYAAQELYQLSSDDTPPKTRISRFVAEKVKEPFEQINDPDVLERVQGQLTDYFDDEGNLTPKGKKLDDHLKGVYANQLNQRVGQWQTQGKTHIQNQQLFTRALQSHLSAIKDLPAEQQRAVYSDIRQGWLENIVDGLDEQGKPLPPDEAAFRQADVAVWGNRMAREILIKQILENKDKLSESEWLKKLL